MASTRRKVLVFAICLALVGAVVFLLWFKKSDQPLRLKIVRTGIEQEKPVAFFRVTGAESRRIKIVGVEKIIGNTSKSPFTSTGLFAPRTSNSNFWAASSEMPIGDSGKARSEFGVVGVTNAPNWTLEVAVAVEGSNRFQLGILKLMIRNWRLLRLRGWPYLKTARITWNAIYNVQYQTIESDPITNAVAFGGEVTK